jgi:hypothetical protein
MKRSERPRSVELQAKVTNPTQAERFRTKSGSVGALAVGALAIGALAVGRLLVRRLAIGNARVRSLKIEELQVKRLRVSELVITDALATPCSNRGIVDVPGVQKPLVTASP